MAKEKKENSKQIDQNLEETSVVPKKRVVYTEIDDEVTEIYEKIKPLNIKKIYIVVPKRAIIFHSLVNLKILKRKCEDDGKTIYLITNDQNGIHLAFKLGIKVFNKSGGNGPAIVSSSEDEKIQITPLTATVNELADQAPTRMKEKKLSISQILNKGKCGKGMNVKKIEKSDSKEKAKKKSSMVLVAPNRHALIGLIVVSVFVLLIIVYIALPGATIYITPSASVLEKSVNITLADYQINRPELDSRPKNMLASFPISTNISTSVTHFATGKRFSERGANASGNITLFNTTNSAWPLIKDTRFQTSEGIVFRIQQPVTVPAATSSGPGQLEVFVVADQLDDNNAIVGERGNIEPSRFFLPGLSEDSRSKLYAESNVAMSGGITDYVTFITKEDIEAAKSRLNDELLKDALEELRDAVRDKAGITGEDAESYVLLEGDNAVKTGEVRMNVPVGLENKEAKEFTVSGEVSVSGIYYNREEMLAILKEELLLKKSPQKELLRINEDSTSYRIFEWNDANGKVKLTANIKGIEQFIIDTETEEGRSLMQKIRDHIVGKEVQDAEIYVQNLPQVNKVVIESWPAWSPTIPNLQDNIDFEIRSAIEVDN